MSEFNNRMSMQRQILEFVNARQWEKEELFGLSSKAIERWASINQVGLENNLVDLLRIASSKLFFLSAMSQEQVSDRYELLSSELYNLSSLIRREVQALSKSSR